MAELVDQSALGPLVGEADEVGRALAADLQLLDLAEVTTQPPRHLARSAVHDGDQAGMGNQGLLLIHSP